MFHRTAILGDGAEIEGEFLESDVRFGSIDSQGCQCKEEYGKEPCHVRMMDGYMQL